MSIISISVIVAATIIGVLMQVAKKLKEKKDTINRFYIKQVKSVMITLVLIEVAIILVVFLIKVSF